MWKTACISPSLCMRSIVLVLACCAFTSHGRRLLPTQDRELRLQDDTVSYSKYLDERKPLQSEGPGLDGKVFAALLLGLDPAASMSWLTSPWKTGNENATDADVEVAASDGKTSGQVEQTAEPAKRAQKASAGPLGRTNKRLRNAVRFDRSGKVIAANKDKLIQSFEDFTAVLDKLGGIGRFLSGNIKKMKNAKVASGDDYAQWLLSELPVHAAKQYKDVADPSAAVANMWIAWILEFFVECFANIQKGQETAESIDDAYKRTLSSHHNYVMRKAFLAGVSGQMPSRQQFLLLLRGGSSDGGNRSPAIQDPTAIQEVEEFVKIGRGVVRYMKDLNDDVFQSLEAERRQLDSKKKRRKNRSDGEAGASSLKDDGVLRYLKQLQQDILRRFQVDAESNGPAAPQDPAVVQYLKQVHDDLKAKLQGSRSHSSNGPAAPQDPAIVQYLKQLHEEILKRLQAA
mmetsp:Transcript_63591/g.110828  ORF Transcript_63591/g.110828 Transcript_63591/m.110828 type:complete len:458 (+) Transcript_63591:56-1429(+)